MATHHYTLLRDGMVREDGTIIADDIVISMGEHGAMHVHPVQTTYRDTVTADSGERLKEIIEHNIAEMQRAMEEGAKWEMRLKESPLGKTQQDFVAYYAEVIALFTEWFIAHRVTVPNHSSK